MSAARAVFRHRDRSKERCSNSWRCPRFMGESVSEQQLSRHSSSFLLASGAARQQRPRHYGRARVLEARLSQPVSLTHLLAWRTGPHAHTHAAHDWLGSRHEARCHRSTGSGLLDTQHTAHRTAHEVALDSLASSRRGCSTCHVEIAHSTRPRPCRLAGAGRRKHALPAKTPRRGDPGFRELARCAQVDAASAKAELVVPPRADARCHAGRPRTSAGGRGVTSALSWCVE